MTLFSIWKKLMAI